MNVAIVGTGYVGLVTGTCLAEMGNNITCVDIDKKKIDLLKDGIIPIYEPGLEDLVKSNFTAGRLHFTTDIQTAINKNEILVIAVGTPPNEDGSADLKHVLAVAEAIGKFMTESKIVVNKSTVPVGTGDKVKDTIASEIKKRGENIKFYVASNPEFLKEGTAVNDFMRPDRIVIGCGDEYVREKLQEMYHPFVLNGHRVIFMDIRSAELTKYAANGLLATKISFMNEVARVAEKVGADISAIRQGIGSDARIGFHFIYPGLGYGGSCFPKDVKSLVQTGQENGMKLEILEAVENVNKTQRQFFIDKIMSHYKNNVKGKRFAIWGLSFKPETDDIREAPAIDVISALIKNGAEVVAFDPIAANNMHAYMTEYFPAIMSSFKIVDDQYEVLSGADALILITEWKPFRSPNFVKIKELLKKPIIFDGRNQYDPEQLHTMGFSYFCIGRKGTKGTP
ncbi:MAG: UDP-glucose 6-dehydrogenase [Bdellovibrionales bacterium RBG_16_40_8]|nr:MAG: UDP-glucose 6-dehydrogenase [Bdellovibrionales bacterium RBG_16_40_8]